MAASGSTLHSTITCQIWKQAYNAYMLVGHVAVEQPKADRSHELVPYDSTIPEHGKEFPIVFYS